MKVGRTGYQVKIQSYGEISETPSVTVTLLDPSGRTVERVTITAPISENGPALKVEQTPQEETQAEPGA